MTLTAYVQTTKNLLHFPACYGHGLNIGYFIKRILYLILFSLRLTVQSMSLCMEADIIKTYATACLVHKSEKILWIAWVFIVEQYEVWHNHLYLRRKPGRLLFIV